MINIEQHKSKILAAHFASTMKTSSSPEDLEFFIRSHRAESQPLKQWWDDMEALRVIRYAENQWNIHPPETDPNPNSVGKVSMGIDEVVIFANKKIGKVYNYYRTVLPQEMQIKIAYDSLIERFMGFLQRGKCAILLFENDLALQIFIPFTDLNAEFDLSFEWNEFIKFAYSETELYKSFTLLVNSLELTNRGFGYVRFPPATIDMTYWLAAFYIATLRERVLRNTDNYKNANDAFRKARDNVKKCQDQLNTNSLTERRRTSIEVKLYDENQKLNDAMQDRRSALRMNQKVFDRIISGLRNQTNTSDFDHAKRLSYQFNRTGAMQFSYGTVKLKSQGGKSSIEDTIVEILNATITPLSCPFVLIDDMVDNSVCKAGDDAKNRCYSCGRPLPTKEKHQQANRFVLGDPSQRLQSGGSQKQPDVCGECLTIAFACSVKLTSGSIVLQLATDDQIDRSFSIENHLRMLTLGELNLVAGRYLLINCQEYVGSGNERKLVSEKIGQIQYTLWRVACIFPATALQTMKFSLFVGGTRIRVESRHFVWLSILNEIFSPNLVVGQRDNIPLGQAIRLIQKDEVISAIYKLVTAEFPQVIPIHNQSYSEKQSLEELREKHCELLEKSSNGDKLMSKQAEFYRDVAALTGLTYAYCDYLRGELRKKPDIDTVREVKKLIEKVVNPSFFNYEASDVLPGTRATMYRNPDNYFCYDQAKLLLENTLNVEMSARAKPDEKGPQPLAIYFDDILNAYAKLSEKYNKTQRRKLSYQLKLNLYAKFASLFSQKEINQNGN
ncbi:hypothetical protein C6497_09445 [Candidatus Poribacteria bacterium]|nr:MAG: hypothetical protein C6497_09445 [Candidatus Poribacteria bacterium]